MPATSQQNSVNRAPNTPGGGNPSTQNRDEGKPHIVTITQENVDRVSILHKGLLQNLDGTLSMTPQYDTWTENTNMQLQELYVTTPGMPAEINDWYHPEPTLLNLKWSHEGEWVKIPTSRDDKGPDYKDCRMGRIEKYIDLEGKIRRAVSYGNEELKLKVWFNIEDMKAAFPDWHIPHPCPYYNGRRFNLGQRRQAGSNSNPTSKPNPQPRDQSGKDIQGRRGNQQPYRGRGKGSRGYQPRGRVTTYQEWDNQQSTSSNNPRDGQHYRDQQQQYSRPQRDSHRNQQQPRENYKREKSPKSPIGFWPNPDEEMFFKTRTPPGKYQIGGKAGGEQKSSTMIYWRKILNGKIVGK